MKLIFFFLLVFIFFACERNRTDEVKSALQRYDQFILSMQPDSLAACFLPDGKLGGEGQPAIVGQDSIRIFLKSFQGAKVLKNESTSSKIEINGEVAHQMGEYQQVIVLLEKGDTLQLTGHFDATWIEVEKSVWKLKTMYTSNYTNRKYSEVK